MNRLRLSLKHRFAALGLVGALMVLLPLVQVLRYQGAELKAALAQQATLDPVLLAGSAQRAVLDHQPLAAQVLRGQAAAEPLRRTAEGQVDQRLARLEKSVTLQGDIRALQEQESLQRDWRTLATEVQTRRLTPAASDAGHRLLVEQLLQVVDLLTLGAWTPDARDGAVQDLARQARQALPRMAVALASLGDGQAAGRPVQTATALAHHFEALAQAAEAAADAGLPGAPADLLARHARHGALAARELAQARSGSPAAREALAGLHLLHGELLDPLQAVLQPGLQARVDRLQRQRQLTLALGAGLCTLALWLLAGAWREVRTAARDAQALALAEAAEAPPGTAAPQTATTELISRLREPSPLPSPRSQTGSVPVED